MEAANTQEEVQMDLQPSAASPAELGAAVAPGPLQRAAPPQQNGALSVPGQSAAPIAAGTDTAGGGAGALVRQSRDGPFNVQLVQWGLSQETARDALNPGEASVC